jgi:phosphoglycolate phosphatase-like HAD superfamily hydrolase
VEYAHAVLKANCPQCSSSDYSRAGDEGDGIYRRFSSIHGANSVPRPKPHGDGILLCCEEMGLHPSRVIYVGDAPTDARAAVDARCRAAIGVLWGSNDEECLGKEAVFDELCGNVEELATAIGRYL